MGKTITLDLDAKYSLREIINLFAAISESKVEKKEETYLSVKEVAERIGCSDATVRSYIQNGQLNAIKYSARLWKVTESEVERFMRSRT